MQGQLPFQSNSFSLFDSNYRWNSYEIETASSGLNTINGDHVQDIDNRYRDEVAHRMLESVDKQRCGGINHSSLTRPCLSNDTNCGQWIDRFFHPTSCYYQDISPEQARKCLGNRTLAFIGDSFIRDIATGVLNLLTGKYSLQSAPNEKFEFRRQISKRGDPIPHFQQWKQNNPSGHNGYILPKNTTSRKNNWNWQIQYWSLYTAHLMEDNQAFDILNNTTPTYLPDLKVLVGYTVRYDCSKRLGIHEPKLRKVIEIVERSTPRSACTNRRG